MKWPGRTGPRLSFLEKTPLTNALQFDITLARRLSYYTGCIFEVAAIGVPMGSIGGGGRYADLTGVFGVPGLSGVGISFGADRIYDVMDALEVFPEALSASVQVLLAAFDEPTHAYAFECATQLRAAGLAVEPIPGTGKIEKAIRVCRQTQCSVCGRLGETEMQTGKLTVKNQQTGEQAVLTVEEAVALILSI